MKKINRRLHVIENRALSPDIFVLTLGLDAKDAELNPNLSFQNIRPGQFASLLVEHERSVFLRRPFSIHDVDVAHRFLKFYIQKKGKGTQQLAKLTTKDAVDVIFPLGNGFGIVESGKLKVENKELTSLRVSSPEIQNSKFKINFVEGFAVQNSILLVGGGCGIAPLLFLAKVLNQKNIRPTILIGGRSKRNILGIENYVRYGNVLITTEDGSFGSKGLVTEHPIFHQQKFDRIYCCGPDPMMKAVAKIAIEKGIPCQISLENMMACGIGACLCCVTPTKEGHKCVCTEGPVFEVREFASSSY